MERRRRRTQTHVLMRNIVIASSVISSVVNLTILAISASAGHWIFGPVFCQFYGLLSQVLISGSAWMVALAAIERCYCVLVPTEHPATFSNTNLKIMVFGLYLMLIVLHTSPLYGWGEYNFHRGGVGLHVGMTNKLTQNISQDPVFNKFILTGEKNTVNFNSTVGSNDGCTKEHTMTPIFVLSPPNIAVVMKTFFADEFDCNSRTIMSGGLLIILRFSKRSCLQMFIKSFYDGVLTKRLHSFMFARFSAGNTTIPKLEFDFSLQEEELRHYSDVHLTFQGIGICGLDFSTVNPSISSWIPFTILINVTPYLLALFCGCVLHKLTSSVVRRLNPNADFYIFCSLTGILSIIPYYYVNIQNHQGKYVDHFINLFVTVLYFTSTLSYILTFMCFGCCLHSAFLHAYSQKECYSESEDNAHNLRKRALQQRDSGTYVSGNSDMSNTA